MASLNILLTSTCWRNDHNGFYQGPGLIDSLLSLAPGVVRVWLPPDANTGCRSWTTACAARTMSTSSSSTSSGTCSTSRWTRRTYPGPGRGHLGVGLQRRTPRSPTSSSPPPATYRPGGTGATELLREWTPELKVRFVNVVDLMALLLEEEHPHGYVDSVFDDLFTADRR